MLLGDWAFGSAKMKTTHSSLPWVGCSMRTLAPGVGPSLGMRAVVLEDGRSRRKRAPSIDDRSYCLYSLVSTEWDGYKCLFLKRNGVFRVNLWVWIESSQKQISYVGLVLQTQSLSFGPKQNFFLSPPIPQMSSQFLDIEIGYEFVSFCDICAFTTNFDGLDIIINFEKQIEDEILFKKHLGEREK